MLRRLAPLALLLVACSDATLEPSSTDGGVDAASSDAMPRDGGSTSDGGGSLPTAPMPLLSENVPAFASSGNPKDANDTNPASAWGAPAGASWIAYDLGSAPLAERQKVLVSWTAIHAPCYIDTGAPGSGQRPLDYVIEANAATSSTAPTSGWTPLVTISANRYCARQHVVPLGGARWIRMSISKSTSDGLGIDLAIHGAASGATDSWLFMGDSITYMSLTYAFSDLPALVRALSSKHVPAVIDAAIGGTNTETARDVIDDTMKDFPGRFVVLAYGTNDHANSFAMETLVQKVIAAGKTPVVPHMPWSSGSPEGAAVNLLIDALYVKYQAIVIGPDLWKTFEGHTEWIPQGDVHPNAAGQEELRKAWAKAMLTAY